MKIELNVSCLRDGSTQTCAFTLSATRLVFGRDLSSPLQLEGIGLSREHFALFLDANAVRIEDLSSNGTRVNGARLQKEVPVELHPGDSIEIPAYRMEVVVLPEEHVELGPAPAAPPAAPEPVEPVAAAPGRLAPVWRFMRSFNAVEKFALFTSLLSFLFAFVGYKFN